MKFERCFWVALATLAMGFFITGGVVAQGKIYEGPDDPAGDIAAIREGYMNGNRVLLYFKNTTELAYWPNNSTSRWPNDNTGLGMLDGVALYVGARVYVRVVEGPQPKYIPVCDPDSVEYYDAKGELDTLYFIQTNFRQGMDSNDAGTVLWGLYPVFGYFNENSEYPAMSNKPESWPPNGWPSRGDQLKWPGEWDGRFGRGVKYADLETYFVVNDAQDQEYLVPDAPVKYYPRPGVKIGDKRPDVTIQKGFPWGGIGIRVKVRGYQWNNVQARDAIFWEYDISNISDYDLLDVAFGFMTDTGIGHKGYSCDQDDLGYFDDYVDMAYFWDTDGIGTGGIRTGIMGIAFLESPGKFDDGIDNDDDGLIDERRDNPAGNIVGPYDGIADLDKFLKWYGLDEEDLREHYEGDEDQDWIDGNDENHNGVYDEEEFPGDDVGLDGVGPGELNYTGPDPDGSECNHKPDFLEGYGCEPNFNATDISESDMIGLTCFRMYDEPPFDQAPFAAQDKETFEVLSAHELIEWTGVVGNLYTLFGTGTFTLYKGRTERISMAILHSFDDLSGLQSAEHAAPSLFQKKQIVQGIYESDYRFAQPPKMPTLTAIPGDGKVILTWDDVADRLTREPLLRGVNDFEGYKLYKATDKHFQDAELITDMYGSKIGKKPIFQCDLKDGKKGAADFVVFNGVCFYLGDDTGIQHYFVDYNVENGRTYYYGLTAYDYGIDGEEVDIMPSENNLVIELDESENIVAVGRNVQVVVPRKSAAGYVSPSIDIIEEKTSLVGTGEITPEVLNDELVDPDAEYIVKFLIDTLGYLKPVEAFRSKYDLSYVNYGYYVKKGDSVIYKESPEKFFSNNIQYSSAGKYYYLNKEVVSDPFDGLQLRIRSVLEPEFDFERTGWIKGSAPIVVMPSMEESRYYPWTYDIVFTGDDSYVSKVSATRGIKNLDGKEINEKALLGQKLNFYVLITSFKNEEGLYDTLDLVVYDLNGDSVYSVEDDVVLAGHTIAFGSNVYWVGTVFSIDLREAYKQGKMPVNGDIYRVEFKRPFIEADSLVFRVKPAVNVDKNKLKNDMENIKVVPNPYIATNEMEPAVYNPFLNQPRRLMFTNIPANCVIKIFTSSGVLIDEINVENEPSNGIVHWDMLTREGLEIASGVYIYYVRSKVTGEVKMGKFAVVK